MALSLLATNKAIRFIYWDEFSPREFASRPSRSPTVPAMTFKRLSTGQILRIQVSQAHHDDNPDFMWTRGAAITAPAGGTVRCNLTSVPRGCAAYAKSYHPV